MALGRVDATLQDSASAQAFFETPEGANFQLSGKAADDIGVLGPGTAIGLAPGNTALQTKINTAFKEMRTSGAYDEMLKPYLKYGLIAPK